MSSEFLTPLAQNGPWALVAGFLLWKVIEAWQSDRKQLTELLTGFSKTLEALAKSIEDLKDEIKRK